MSSSEKKSYKRSHSTGKISNSYKLTRGEKTEDKSGHNSSSHNIMNGKTKPGDSADATPVLPSSPSLSSIASTTSASSITTSSPKGASGGSATSASDKSSRRKSTGAGIINIFGRRESSRQLRQQVETETVHKNPLMNKNWVKKKPSGMDGDLSSDNSTNNTNESAPQQNRPPALTSPPKLTGFNVKHREPSANASTTTTVSTSTTTTSTSTTTTMTTTAPASTGSTVTISPVVTIAPLPPSTESATHSAATTSSISTTSTGSTISVPTAIEIPSPSPTQPSTDVNVPTGTPPENQLEARDLNRSEEKDSTISPSSTVIEPPAPLEPKRVDEESSESSAMTEPSTSNSSPSTIQRATIMLPLNKSTPQRPQRPGGPSSAPPKPARRLRSETGDTSLPPRKPPRPFNLPLDTNEAVSSPRASAASLSSLMIATIEAKEVSPRTTTPAVKPPTGHTRALSMYQQRQPAPKVVLPRSPPSIHSIAGELTQPVNNVPLPRPSVSAIQLNSDPARAAFQTNLSQLLASSNLRQVSAQQAVIGRSISSMALKSEVASLAAAAAAGIPPPSENSENKDTLDPIVGAGVDVGVEWDPLPRAVSEFYITGANNSASTTITTNSTGVALKLSLSDEIATLMKLKSEFENRLENAPPGATGLETCNSALREVNAKLLLKRKRLLVLYRQLRSQKDILKKELEKYPNIISFKKRKSYLATIPATKVMAMEGAQLLTSLAGPEPNENAVNFYDTACCRTVSSYPRIGGRRAGDPICDVFRLDIMDCAWIVSVADGCNWGAAPRAAAERAANGFTHYIKSRLALVGNTRRIGGLILRAFSYAHQSIINGRESEDSEVGTTTLLGGILVPALDSASDPKMGKWVFIYAGVGDCKAFLWSHSTRTLSDITAQNRGEVLDARDCGGRLGPYIDGGPDLRNFRAHYQLCYENDLLIIVSDGVHDNLDPEQMGKLPKDLDPTVTVNSWSELDPIIACELKNNHRCKLFNDIILNTIEPESTWPSPTAVTNAAIKHCLQQTSSSREWMESNPLDPLPCDYTKYPGKMDHTTCVCLRVGLLSPAYIQRSSSNLAVSQLASTTTTTTTTPTTTSIPTSTTQTSLTSLT